LRYYLQRDKGALNAVLRIFLRVVRTSLQTHCPGAAKADPASLHLGVVAFIHRFGSSLNTHVHFHVYVVDWVFEAVAAPMAQPVDTDAGAQASPEPSPAPAPQSVAFHAATGLDEAAISQVQAHVRKRILRTFVARGHLEACDAKDINESAASSNHGGGFSVDAGVRIKAPDRAGLERLLRCCARPPFAMDRLKQCASVLVYRCGKGHAEPLQSDKYSGELVLTPLELINRIAQLVPPPRTHRHRCGKVKVRRRRGRVLRLSRTGIWQTNHRPITPTISARLGEFAAMGMGRDGCAGVGLCLRAASAVHGGDGGANSW
jgi:hypothetical protein